MPNQGDKRVHEETNSADTEGEVGDTGPSKMSHYKAKKSNKEGESEQATKKQHVFKSPYDKEELQNFPQRTRWEIPDSKVVFSSQFCSGNLARAQRGYQKNSYDLWVAADASPHMDSQGDYYKTWFYFSVTGIPQGEIITFTFKNLSNQTKLYNQGLKPVFKVTPTHQPKFRRIMTKVSHWFNEDQFMMQFTHMFAYPESQTTYFAFTFPFSFDDMTQLTDKMERQVQGQSNIYWNREVMYYSLEGRPLELLTISSMDQITDERETIPDESPGMFPAAIQNPDTRPLRFQKEKPVIFMTSRVHPGETPGSHVLNGFLELLTDIQSEQGRCLRKNYVFKVLMALNPDGVSRGYYRLDTTASNLNRFYLNPDRKDQPTIWATKKAVVQQADQYKSLLMFIDFHAHASKRGGFMFGNHLTDPERQTDNITFVKLIAMNCLNFDMNECNFSDRIMAIKDRNGQSREGSSRVALQKATGLTHCYTLEFNYHSGRRINTLAPKYARQGGTIEPETEVTDPGSKIYLNNTSPPFTQQIFEDCGRAVGAALLDYCDDNPISRIPLSCYRTVKNVRTDILNNLQKYESGNVNVCGANHFAPTNTKVAKAFANTPGPKIKINGGSAGPRSQQIEQEKLRKAASLLMGASKPQGKGTFGVSKRIVDEFSSSNNYRANQTSGKEKESGNRNERRGRGGVPGTRGNKQDFGSQPPPARSAISTSQKPPLQSNQGVSGSASSSKNQNVAGGGVKLKRMKDKGNRSGQSTAQAHQQTALLTNDTSLMGSTQEQTSSQNGTNQSLMSSQMLRFQHQTQSNTDKSEYPNVRQSVTIDGDTQRLPAFLISQTRSEFQQMPKEQQMQILRAAQQRQLQMSKMAQIQQSTQFIIQFANQRKEDSILVKAEYAQPQQKPNHQSQQQSQKQFNAPISNNNANMQGQSNRLVQPHCPIILGPKGQQMVNYGGLQGNNPNPMTASHIAHKSQIIGQNTQGSKMMNEQTPLCITTSTNQLKSNNIRNHQNRNEVEEQNNNCPQIRSRSHVSHPNTNRTSQLPNSSAHFDQAMINYQKQHREEEMIQIQRKDGNFVVEVVQHAKNQKKATENDKKQDKIDAFPSKEGSKSGARPLKRKKVRATDSSASKQNRRNSANAGQKAPGSAKKRRESNQRKSGVMAQLVEDTTDERSKFSSTQNKNDVERKFQNAPLDRFQLAEKQHLKTNERKQFDPLHPDMTHGLYVANSRTPGNQHETGQVMKKRHPYSGVNPRIDLQNVDETHDQEQLQAYQHQRLQIHNTTAQQARQAVQSKSNHSLGLQNQQSSQGAGGGDQPYHLPTINHSGSSQHTNSAAKDLSHRSRHLNGSQNKNLQHSPMRSSHPSTGSQMQKFDHMSIPNIKNAENLGNGAFTSSGTYAQNRQHNHRNPQQQSYEHKKLPSPYQHKQISPRNTSEKVVEKPNCFSAESPRANKYKEQIGERHQANIVNPSREEQLAQYVNHKGLKPRKPVFSGQQQAIPGSLVSVNNSGLMMPSSSQSSQQQQQFLRQQALPEYVQNVCSSHSTSGQQKQHQQQLGQLYHQRSTQQTQVQQQYQQMMQQQKAVYQNALQHHQKMSSSNHHPTQQLYSKTGQTMADRMIVAKNQQDGLTPRERQAILNGKHNV